MKTLSASLIAATLLAAPGFAQKVTLDLSSIAAKASEKAELDLSGPMLDFAKQMATQNGGGEYKDIYSGVDSIALRAYKFAAPGQYSDHDLDAVRKQAGPGSGWSRLVNASKSDQSAEIYVFNKGDKVAGIFLIAAKPQELAVIEITGSVDINKVQELIQSTIKYSANAQ